MPRFGCFGFFFPRHAKLLAHAGGGVVQGGIQPHNSTAPEITGALTEGATLTRTPGIWTGTPAPTVTWQWTQNGTDIAGETGNTFRIPLGWAGSAVSGYETADNGVGPPKIANATGGGTVIATTLPTVEFTTVSVTEAEGNTGSTAFLYTLSRSGDVSGASSVDFAVTGSGGSPAAAADFAGGVLPGGTVNFAAGDATATCTINVAGDTVAEGNEGFTVTISNPVGCVLGTATTALGVIQDDELAAPILSNLPGFVAGTNPPQWGAEYPALQVWDASTSSGDKVRMRWRIDGGAWNVEADVLADDAFVLSDDYTWADLNSPILTGGFFEAEEQTARFVGGVETYTSTWSPVWSDTLPAVAFDPATLFDAGELGYIFDPSDTSKFFQNSDGTGAGAFGSPIGLLKDQSPNTADFSQATAGSRPNAVAPGWAQYDGVDDFLERYLVTSASSLFGTTLTGTFSCVMALQGAANQISKAIWSEESRTSNNVLYMPGTQTDAAASSGVRALVRNDSTASVGTNVFADAALDNAAHVLSIADVNASGHNTITVWKDRVAATAYTYTKSGGFSINEASFGANRRTTNANFFAGKIGRAVFINRAMTNVERANVEAWCAAPYGITLP